MYLVDSGGRGSSATLRMSIAKARYSHVSEQCNQIATNVA